MTTPRRALLLQAADTIDGDRNDTYGGPESSFKTIAALWHEYLMAIPGDVLQPHDVAAMLALLKIARIAGSGGTHKDSWLDLAGYAACGWETVDVPEPADMNPTLEDFAMSLRSVQNGKIRYHNRTYSADELVNWNGDLVLVSTVPGAIDSIRVTQKGGSEICTAYEEV